MFSLIFFTIPIKSAAVVAAAAAAAAGVASPEKSLVAWRGVALLAWRALAGRLRPRHRGWHPGREDQGGYLMGPGASWANRAQGRHMGTPPKTHKNFRY